MDARLAIQYTFFALQEEAGACLLYGLYDQVTGKLGNKGTNVFPWLHAPVQLGVLGLLGQCLVIDATQNLQQGFAPSRLLGLEVGNGVQTSIRQQPVLGGLRWSSALGPELVAHPYCQAAGATRRKSLKRHLAKSCASHLVLSAYGFRFWASPCSPNS